MTRHDGSGSSPTMARSLEPPPSRWSSAEITDAGQALQTLERAARELITRMSPSNEWSEVEGLAIQLISQVGMCFLTTPEPAFASKLRRALDALQSANLIERRAWAVRAIVEWAPKWQAAASEAQRRWAASELVRRLAICDSAFTGLDLEMLGAKLSVYSPTPARIPGARGAEAVLAEIIAEDCDALGFSDQSEDATENIRRALVRDVGKYVKPAE